MERIIRYINSNRIYSMVLFAMLMMHASLLMLLFNRDFPAFDDMVFLSSYVGKLSTEGRWINYLIFHLVKRFNFDVVLIVNAIALFVFCFKVARNICSSQMSYAIAVFACFALPFYNVADSSLTLMSMYLIGVLAVLLCDKMQKIYFFVIFGILYCGVVSPFYFLLIAGEGGMFEVDHQIARPGIEFRDQCVGAGVVEPEGIFLAVLGVNIGAEFQQLERFGRGAFGFRHCVNLL